MRYALIVLAAAALAGCAGRSLPDTPIGNYDGTWGPTYRQEPAGVTYRCAAPGGTEVIVRGAKNPDPQACKPVERI